MVVIKRKPAGQVQAYDESGRLRAVAGAYDPAWAE
jgi:hypothetical protein